jgi:hypothetical protein
MGEKCQKSKNQLTTSWMHHPVFRVVVLSKVQPQLQLVQQ